MRETEKESQEREREREEEENRKGTERWANGGRPGIEGFVLVQCLP